MQKLGLVGIVFIALSSELQAQEPARLELLSDERALEFLVDRQKPAAPVVFARDDSDLIAAAIVLAVDQQSFANIVEELKKDPPENCVREGNFCCVPETREFFFYSEDGWLYPRTKCPDFDAEYKSETNVGSVIVSSDLMNLLLEVSRVPGALFSQPSTDGLMYFINAATLTDYQCRDSVAGWCRKKAWRKEYCKKFDSSAPKWYNWTSVLWQYCPVVDSNGNNVFCTCP